MGQNRRNFFPGNPVFLCIFQMEPESRIGQPLPCRDKYTALLVFKRNYYVLWTILIFTVQQIGNCRFCILVGLNYVPVCQSNNFCCFSFKI